MNQKELDRSIIDFCYYYSFIIALIEIFLLFIIIILCITNKKKSIMTSFSIHLTIAAFSNAISYLCPYTSPENTITFICRFQALIHILSFIMTVNMLFVYFLLNLLIFLNPLRATSNTFHLIIYCIHWVITITLGILNYSRDPVAGRLEVCRYDVTDIIPIINTVYSSILIFYTTVVFCVIQCMFCKKIKESLKKEEIKMYKTVFGYFFIVIMIVLIKFTSFFVKEQQEKMMNLFYLIDRVWENLTSFLLIVTLVIGKEGFVEIWKTIMKCKRDKTCQNKAQLEKINVIENDQFDSSAFED